MLLSCLSLFCSFSVLRCTNPRAEGARLDRLINRRNTRIFAPVFIYDFPSAENYFSREAVLQEFWNLPVEHVVPQIDLAMEPAHEEPEPAMAEIVRDDADEDDSSSSANLKPVAPTPTLPRRLLTHVINKIRATLNLQRLLVSTSGTDLVYSTAVDLFEKLLGMASEANISVTIHGVAINPITIGAAKARLTRHRDSGFKFTKSRMDPKKLRTIICGAASSDIKGSQCLRDVAKQLSAYAIALYHNVDGIRFDRDDELVVKGARFPTSAQINQYTCSSRSKRAREVETVVEAAEGANPNYVWVTENINEVANGMHKRRRQK